MAAGWEVYPDFAGGCNYYRNTDTGVVMWTRPADFPAPDYTQHFSAGGRTSHLREGGGSKELDAGADDSDDPLAEDMCAKYTGAGVADTDTDQDDAHVQPVDDTTKLAWVLADTTRLAGDLKDKKVDPAWFESTFHDQDTTVKAKWVVRFSQDNDAKIVAPSALRADEQDLTLLDSLDPELVLFHLQKRFAKKAIYTNIGPIVVSINPLLKREAQQSATGAAEERARYRAGPKDDEEPHIYVTARNAHRAATQDIPNNQSIIISGESGSGKTFATKMMLKYIMEAGSGKGGDVAEKIEATNPVLEAFGNAKTRNNDNSSRFGKYLKVFLDDDGTVTGAKAEHYLLETVRVVKKNDQERNYHIFYMMLAPPGDAPPADEEDEADEEPIPDPGPVVFSAEPFRLEQDAQKYTYLKHDPALTTDRKDPADFRKLRKAFRRLNFAEDDEMAIYKILAGILHCGNMEFEGGDKATIKRTDALGHAAACFGVTAEQLSAGICKKTGMDNGTKVQYDRSVSVAQAARDTMCKYLYGYVFDFLLAKLNSYTVTPGASDTRFIGCLDIFGFEKMATNSLEQLCINYTNEMLQQQFDNFTVTKERDHLKAEGIEDVMTTETNSQKRNTMAIRDIPAFLEALDVLAVKGARTEEGTCNDGEAANALAVKFPWPVGQAFKKAFGEGAGGVSTNKAIAVNATNAKFRVAHYAGTLEYDLDGFCSKSIDKLDESATAMLDMSRLDDNFMQKLLREAGQGLNGKCAKKTAGNTTGTKFVFRVCKLIQELEKVQPHYVRCIKSNKDDDQWTLDAGVCYEQLKFAGVFQAVEIRSKGFPFSKKHEDFVDKYSCIVTERDGKKQDADGNSVDDRGAGEALNGTVKEKAEKILDYTFQKMQHKVKRLQEDGYRHRALETLHEPASTRASLRKQLYAQLTGNIKTPEDAHILRNTVKEVKASRVYFGPTNTVDVRVKDKLKDFAKTSLKEDTATQLQHAIDNNNKGQLANLLNDLPDDVNEVDPVPAAVTKLCNLVSLDKQLDDAVKTKDEDALVAALATVKQEFGAAADGDKFVSDRHKRAHVALEFIRNIAKHLGQACIDGIQAHEDAVLAAAQDVKFSNNHASDDMKCLKDRQAPARMTAAIMNRDFPEAARIQISIFATDTSGLNALKELDKYLNAHALTEEEKQRRKAMDVFGDNSLAGVPPFTSTAGDGSAFQHRLLEQAAVDNFETVQAYLGDKATAQQLHDTFTSCFMNEWLRDELFVAIFKASTGSIKDDDKACELLQLALGHFGPSDDLCNFVRAMVQECGPKWHLVQLLARRRVDPTGNVPWTYADDSSKDVREAARQRIQYTFVEFEQPNYSGASWAGLANVWDPFK